MSIKLIIAGLIIAAAFPIKSSRAATGIKADVKVTKVANSANEQYERDVDQVALASQNEAISKLTGLLKKYRGTRQEPILLARLGELQQQNGAILFRIAHGRAHHSQRPLDLTAYKSGMKQAISTHTQLIAKYPHYEEIRLAYALRGKGFEEIGDKKSATRDYLHLLQNYPDADETVSATMSLAEFSIEANDHARAIQLLKLVEAKPETPHFPFALYKLAWSHYNMKNVPSALSYIERHVAFYEPGKNETSEAAFREASLQDAALFYAEGYEQKLPQYPLADALSYFRKLEDGAPLGKMALRFAKILRSHGHEADLVLWKDQFIESESARPESLDIVLTTFENQVNKNRFQQLTESAQDMVRLSQANKKFKEFDSYPKAQKMLLDTAESYQALLIKNKDATEVGTLSATLVSIYDAFTRIVDETDPRIPMAHYNLAETLFAIRSYEKATEHYRWVVEHGPFGGWKPAKTAKAKAIEAASVPSASLRSIASRYEVLKQKQVVPETLAAVSFDAKGQEIKDETLAKQTREWIDWIDTHIDKTGDPIDNFYFEANRMLYRSGEMKKAAERMREFAKDHPDSKYAVPSASLVIDTYIASAQWQETHDLANDYLDIDAWKKQDFSKRLFSIASDSFYKLIEGHHKASEFKDALSKSDKFLKAYVTSERLADTLALAGNAALQLGEKDRAARYFTRLIQEAPKSELVGEAMLARAVLSEEKYLFAAAAGDFRRYLSLPQKPDSKHEALRKKTLMLGWLSGDAAELKASLSSPVICTADLSALCDEYLALTMLSGWRSDPNSLKGDQNAFERARKHDRKSRAIWAAVALENPKELPFRDRLLTAKMAAKGWEELDPLMRYALLPYLSVSIPRVFQMSRMAMAEVAPLKAEERWIVARVDKIREVEQAATEAMKLPWSRIRATVLNEVASLYVDLARGLSSLPPPSGLSSSDIAQYEDTIRRLVLPFEEKGQEMRMKSFEIASKFGIEPEAFKTISEPFFQDNPSQAKALRPELEVGNHEALGLTTIGKIDEDGDWDSVEADSDDVAERLKAQWKRSVTSKNWAQIAFYLQEATQKALLVPSSLSMMKAATLAAAGAQGEGLNEIDTSRDDYKPEPMAKAGVLLLGHAMRCHSRDRAKELVKEISSEHLDDEEAAIVAYSAHWAGVSLDDEKRIALLDAASGSDNDLHSKWARARMQELKVAKAEPAAVDPKAAKRAPAAVSK